MISVETDLEIEMEDLTQIASLNIDLCAIYFEYNIQFVQQPANEGVNFFVCAT